jgi:ubiquinone/menaquinone biosynthesis C-methylase UbiE
MTTMTQTPAQQVTPQRIIQMGWAFALPNAIESALRNRIFDVLDSGPMTLQEVSRQAGCSERGTEALLGLLTAMELVHHENGRYSLTPESATFLVSTKPAYRGKFFLHLSEDLVPQFQQLPEIVRTGNPARRVKVEEVASDFFRRFVDALLPMNIAAAQLVARHLASQRQAETANILDLAAGSGVWGIAMAQAFPKATLTAVDFLDVLSVTREFAQRFGIEERFRTVAGDVLQANFGTGYSIATLGHILHSEGEERSRALLKKTYDALDQGGTIVIAEVLLNEDRTSPMQAAIFNVNMLVNTDKGRAYTFGELCHWLTESGFRNVRTLDAPAPSPLVLADK